MSSHLKHYIHDAFEPVICPFPVQLSSEAANSYVLQSLGHSLHSRERLIQVGEVKSGQGGSTLTGMLFVLDSRYAFKEPAPYVISVSIHLTNSRDLMPITDVCEGT